MAVTREWRAVGRAELTIGQKLGVGGPVWDVTRMSGEGVASPVTASTVGTWAGYVADEDPAALSSAAPATAVGAKRWYAVGASDTLTGSPGGTLAVGDVLASQADPDLAFLVVAVDLVVGYVRYLVAPTAAPASAPIEPGTPLLVFSAAAGSQYLGVV
jgi:hypothetical protein